MPDPTDGNLPSPIPTPTYVVDDSKARAAFMTVFSLVFFGIGLFASLMKLLSAHDLNAVRALLMREDTIGWLAAVTPFFWLAYRTIRSWFKKEKEVKIVGSADDSVAMTKTQFNQLLDQYLDQAAAAPTRARETTTRLVSAAAIHGGPLGAEKLVYPDASWGNDDWRDAPVAQGERIPLMDPLEPLVLNKQNEVDARLTPALSDKQEFNAANRYGVSATVFVEDVPGYYVAKRDVPTDSSIFDTSYWVHVVPGVPGEEG